MRSDSDMCPVFMDVSHEMWGGWGLDVGGERREKRERERCTTKREGLIGGWKGREPWYIAGILAKAICIVSR